MITPSTAPNSAGKARPTSTASGHGAGPGGSSSHKVRVAPITEVYPMDRSISPSSSTNTSAMPSSTIHAACVIRLTRLPADRNRELRTWKIDDDGDQAEQDR